MPSPIAWAGRMTKVSPVPAQITLASDGAIASADTDEADWSSKTGVQFTPPSRVRHSPPDAAPT